MIKFLNTANKINEYRVLILYSRASTYSTPPLHKNLNRFFIRKTPILCLPLRGFHWNLRK